MDIQITKSPPLRGTILAPPSKSYSQRVIALSLLVRKLSIKNLGQSKDEMAALSIVETCGQNVLKKTNGEYIIEGECQFDKDLVIDCSESGFSARLFSVFLALNKKYTRINGAGTLLGRPMDSLEDIYKQLNVDYEWQDGKLPIRIKGCRTYKSLEVDGSQSSQFVSGLIYYLVGLRHTEPLDMRVFDLKSRDYIKMTIHVLSLIGAKIDWKDDLITVFPSQLKSEIEIDIEGDWSSASFWFVAAAINGNITIEGLNIKSLQPDRAIFDIVDKFGANLSICGDNIYIKSAGSNSFEYDATDSPDLIPILTVLAIFADGESTIYGVQRLRFKESDRLVCIEDTLNSLRIQYTILDEFIKIKGKRIGKNAFELKSGLVFQSSSDHRIAMMNSILALYLMEAKIKGIEAVEKSYPNFYIDLENLGGQIK